MTQVAPRRFPPRRSDGHRPQSPHRAFNLMELLVVMAFIGIIMTVTYASLDRTIPRTKLRGKAVEVSSFLQKARLHAIKNGFEVTVSKETTTGNLDWLVASFINAAGTVREVGRLYIGSPNSQYDPHLAGAAGGSVDAAKPLFFGGNVYDGDGKEVDYIKVLSFKPNGTCSGVGAIRLSIGMTERRNTIEVAVLSLGGQPVLRKYIRPADRPPTDMASEFFEDTHYGTSWKWSWY